MPQDSTEIIRMIGDWDLERLENVLVKISKKQELNGSDLSFQSSMELLYGKPEKPGRYGILKKERNKV